MLRTLSLRTLVKEVQLRTLSCKTERFSIQWLDLLAEVASLTGPYTGRGERRRVERAPRR